ncbi:histone H2B.1-like [Carcharodon carcharias]|uniref:histone H2B.1-like n=1 Tax=Carcharodon carcharias TaxID=13397 RepID=UPI001B7DD9E4|nr:histone H2B.1-like [Carcharodon carcharias]
MENLTVFSGDVIDRQHVVTTERSKHRSMGATKGTVQDQEEKSLSQAESQKGNETGEKKQLASKNPFNQVQGAINCAQISWQQVVNYVNQKGLHSLKAQLVRNYHKRILQAMGIMSSFVNGIFERFVGETSCLAHYNKHSTISSWEIQTAMRLQVPRELAKHVMSEGTKAMTKLSNSK